MFLVLRSGTPYLPQEVESQQAPLGQLLPALVRVAPGSPCDMENLSFPHQFARVQVLFSQMLVFLIPYRFS